MTGLLISQAWLDLFGDRLEQAAREHGLAFEYITTPSDPAARLSPEQCERIEVAFFTNELFPDFSRAFFAAAQGSPNLRWLHVFNAGVDNPVFGRLIARGVRVSTSSGSTARPIAESAITGMLMFARGATRWVAQQRAHEWKRTPRAALPRDLSEQTIVVFGLGPIGLEVARLAKAFGLYVIGVRRSPAREGDPLDELRHPSELREILPRADWLVVAAPLTPETRGIFGGSELALLPAGARVVNVARGELFDEPALLTALKDGTLAGAYLDVFETEPLPPESEFWDLPNVIISPHDSAASAGNDERVAAIFLENLGHWVRGEELRNEVRPAG